MDWCGKKAQYMIFQKEIEHSQYVGEKKKPYHNLSDLRPMQIGTTYYLWPVLGGGGGRRGSQVEKRGNQSSSSENGVQAFQDHASTKG